MLGAGGICGAHCAGWKRLTDCELVAVTDINPAAAKKRAEEFKIGAIEPTGAKLIARKDIDVVDIVVPNRFHKQYTVAALRAGKHVLCEKPLALTAAEVDAMIAACRKGRRKLMCAQHMRFQADSQALKQYITRHPLGEIYYARTWHNRRRLLPCTPGFMYRKNAGGGCCLDIGVHALDLGLFLMDNFQPVSVCGVCGIKLAKDRDAWSEWGKIDHRGIDVEDYAVGLIRFANGAAMSLECSFMMNMKPKSEARVDLFGTRAGARWPECEYYDHTSRDYADTAIAVRQGLGGHAAEIEAFARAVIDNKPVPVPPEQSRAVIAILEGLYRSQKAGREVKV